MFSLLIFIPGFGGPKYDFKLKLLAKNINLIFKYNWIKVDIIICKYDNCDTELLKNTIETYNFNDIKVINEKGYFGEYIIRHLNPNKTLSYDYILIMLDDIELINFDMNTLINYQIKHKLDIISPSLTCDSISGTPQMFSQSNLDFNIRVGPVCELFFYLMPSRSYDVYYDLLDIRNPWLWGIDILLNKRLGFKCGILNKIQMKHHLKNTSNQQIEAEKGYWHTLKVNGYDKKEHELLNQQLVFYYD